MKKIIIPIIICILVLLYSVVYADDYSSFSDEELNTQLNAIRNELIARGYSTENKRLLLDQSGVHPVGVCYLMKLHWPYEKDIALLHGVERIVYLIEILAS